MSTVKLATEQRAESTEQAMATGNVPQTGYKQRWLQQHQQQQWKQLVGIFKSCHQIHFVMLMYICMHTGCQM